jgi:hypothetical protein
VEEDMKKRIVVLLALASVSAGAQTISFDQLQHVKTSLNHLTVIDLGEPVLSIGKADLDAFQIDTEGDKILIEPLKEAISTNLAIWTSSRQLNYELDPAGDVSKMTVLIRNAPATSQHAPSTAAVASQLDDQEIQKVTTLAQSQVLIEAQEITHDDTKTASDTVSISVEQIFRGKDQLFIRYVITNLTKAPYRVTAPNVSLPLPTQQPISLVSLKNHQLTPQAFATFKAKQGESLPVVMGRSLLTDLGPGQTTTGVISIKGSHDNSPQLYELRFGTEQNQAIAVAAVL